MIGRAYEYDPKILKKQYFDNVFGSSVSQLFVVPTTSMFMNMFNLKTKWPTFFSLLLSFGITVFSYRAFYIASLGTKIISITIGKYIHRMLYENNGVTTLDEDQKSERLA